MSINGKAYVVGAFEHPTRKAPNTSVAQLHAEVTRGALDDAGLSKDDIDGYFCSADAPGMGRSHPGRIRRAKIAVDVVLRKPRVVERAPSLFRMELRHRGVGRFASGMFESPHYIGLAVDAHRSFSDFLE